ncbi:MAG TPA: flavodoxin domain-containing protein [Thermomicrobiales bacterium]|jgi:menaquinone-dependent protoporphyrinogen oxidase|nr:flavodoxin domain-containing protein [Thermomicrobiales bacterium]
MRFLIAVATKHGSTHGIGEAIAEELRAYGNDVDVSAVGDITSLAPYDAVILGSAVYMGHWLAEARKFIATHQQALITRPVWLFSSGPVGRDQSKRPEDPSGLETLMAEAGARGHRTFHGKLDPSQLGLPDRLMVKLVKAPAGDFRDWDDIQAWARAIANSVRPATALAPAAAVSDQSRHMEQ